MIRHAFCFDLELLGGGIVNDNHFVFLFYPLFLVFPFFLIFCARVSTLVPL